MNLFNYKNCRAKIPKPCGHCGDFGEKKNIFTQPEIEILAVKSVA